MILITTATQDLHALLIQKTVRSMGFNDIHIIEIDRIAQRDFLSFGVNYATSDRVLTSEEKSVSISNSSVLWLRRTRANQILTHPLDCPDSETIISNDSRGGLTGLLNTHFKGRWISSPEATVRAADKIYQLHVAFRCGFRIPKTLISQCRDDVIRFAESCPSGVIVKTVVGAPKPFLATIKLDPEKLPSDESFMASPAIYQEYIDGQDHIRLNCFGENSYSAIITSSEIDWRQNLRIPIREAHVPRELHERVRMVLDELGLEMGVIDLKISRDGDPVWLEVNPQGQFIFLDPVANMNLAIKFSQYLIEMLR